MFEKLRIISVLIMMLAISPLSNVYSGGYGAGEPPGSGEQIIGPPIDGVLTATYSNGFSEVVIVGSCKKIPVSFIFPPQAGTEAEFRNTTAEDITNQRQSGVAPPGCFSILGGEDLIVTNVKNFNNTGVAIGADIQISVVKPK